LAKDEVEKMTKEAETHSAEDQAKKEKIEARNKADTLIYTAEKTLKDAGEKVAADIKKDVEEKVSALKGILDTGSKEEIESKTNELSDSLQKVGAAMYSQGQQTSANNQQPTEEAKTEEPKKEDKAEEGEVIN